MPKLFIIKICFTIEINSICGVGQDSWNLRHKFNSQGPALRILGLRVAISNSQGPISRVPCPRVQVRGSWVSVSLSPRVPASSLRVLGFRVSSLIVSGSGSQVLILDCVTLYFCEDYINFRRSKDQII